MPPTTAETVPGFWRCRRCKTPNPSAPYLTRCLGCGRPIPQFPSRFDPPAPSAQPSTTSTPSSASGRKTLIASSVYAFVVLVSIGMIRGMSSGWWLVAGLVLMPRWLFLGPLIPLALLAIKARRRSIGALLVVEAWLILVPLMGFSVPIGRLISGTPVGPKVRVMSLNQGGLKLDVPRLLRYLDRYQIDVVCFQELGRNPSLRESLLEAGWQFHPSRRIASRWPIVPDPGQSVEVPKPGSRDSLTCDRVRLRHPEGFEFVVVSARLPTVRWDQAAAQLCELLAESRATPLLVGGEFQMPADCRTMTSICSDYPSAHEQAGWGYGFTSPTRLPWVRVDQILGSRDWTFSRSWVGPDLGSNHLPIIAEAVLTHAGAG